MLSSFVPADLEVLPCCGSDVAIVGRPIGRQDGGSRIVSCPTVPGTWKELSFCEAESILV